MKLTPKQIKFAETYAVTGNASAAYRAAYRSENMKAETVSRNAQFLLKHNKVAARISELQNMIRDKAEKEFDLNVETLLEKHNAIALADAGDLFEWDENGVRVKPSSELRLAQRQIITVVKQAGGQAETIELKLADRIKALEAIARHLGFFELDNQQGAGQVIMQLDKDDGAL